MSSLAFNLGLFRKNGSSKKYGNKKVVIDDITFDSKVEANRYLFLKDKQKHGVISNLECHKTFELIPHQQREEIVHLKTKDKTRIRTIFLPVRFSPDFVYEYKGQTVAEDVKGSTLLVSKDFPIRKKLLYYIHHIYCHIVTKPTEPIPEPF